MINSYTSRQFIFLSNTCKHTKSGIMLIMIITHSYFSYNDYTCKIYVKSLSPHLIQYLWVCWKVERMPANQIIVQVFHNEVKHNSLVWKKTISYTRNMCDCFKCKNVLNENRIVIFKISEILLIISINSIVYNLPRNLNIVCFWDLDRSGTSHDLPFVTISSTVAGNIHVR